MEDNFSTQSNKNAQCRPSYPSELFQFINEKIQEKLNAWDWETANSHVVYELAKTFRKVLATDICQQQIDHASQANNISFSVQPAALTNFDEIQEPNFKITKHWR